MALWSDEILLLASASHGKRGATGNRRGIAIDARNIDVLEVTVAIIYPAPIDAQGVRIALRHTTASDSELDWSDLPADAGNAVLHTAVFDIGHYSRIYAEAQNLSNTKPVIIAAVYRVRYDVQNVMR